MTTKTKTTKVIITVEIPKCWKKLVDMEFPEGLEGITSERHLKGDADPDPHYDDCRTVCGKSKEGAIASVQLCSGQSNYYGGFVIDKDRHTPIYESEPIDSFDDMEAEVGGILYVIKPKWV